MKSTLAISAGCLIAVLGVGDRVYSIPARLGVSFPQIVAVQGAVDTSKLTDQDTDDTTADLDLDSLFAHDGKSIDGIDADELASIRQLASIAKSQASDWGRDFYKSKDGNVDGVSRSTLHGFSGAWDGSRDACGGPLTYAAIGPCGQSLFCDDYTRAHNGSNDRQYGGDPGEGASGSKKYKSHPGVICTTLSCDPVAVPEPGSVGLFLLGGLFLRRRRAR